MKHPTQRRQKFINQLTPRKLAARTVQPDTDWIIHPARFHQTSPDTLGHPKISSW